ncbi:hypothetical protein N1851_001772 [Merluccius polli]|uniref:Uncharacterized protein n=1 Tax=Merluccius polli TaxID=89951 RepID=A0AA47NCK3_MERPO|nr:hypothetical protein N1851_001772 [Merluccius polli]
MLLKPAEETWLNMGFLEIRSSSVWDRFKRVKPFLANKSCKSFMTLQCCWPCLPHCALFPDGSTADLLLRLCPRAARMQRTHTPLSGTMMRALYRTVVVKRELSRKVKLSIYQSIYVPTLTYGHELWNFAFEVDVLCADEGRGCTRHVKVEGVDRIGDRLYDSSLDSASKGIFQKTAEAPPQQPAPTPPQSPALGGGAAELPFLYRISIRSLYSQPAPTEASHASCILWQPYTYLLQLWLARPGGKYRKTLTRRGARDGILARSDSVRWRSRWSAF